MTTNRIRPSVKEIKRLEAEIEYLRQQDPGKELTRLQALVDSFEAANIQRQWIIDSFAEVRKQHAEGAQKLHRRIRELEDRLDNYSEIPEDDVVVDYSLVDADLLTEYAIAVLSSPDSDEVERLEEECVKAATLMPHSQQQIIVDGKWYEAVSYERVGRPSSRRGWRPWADWLDLCWHT